MFSCLNKIQAHAEGIWCVSYAKNNIITGSLDGSLGVFKGDQLENTTLQGHKLGVISVDTFCDRDSCLAVSNSLDSVIRVWDVDKQEKFSVECKPLESWSVRFSPDGKSIVTGSHNGIVHLYSSDGSLKHSVDTKGKFLMKVEYSVDGKLIAASSQNGNVYILDAAAPEGPRLLNTISGTHTVRAVAFTPDSQTLIIGNDEGRINVYDPRTSGCVATLPGHCSWVLSLACNIDGNHFASSSSDKKVKIWSLSQRQCLHIFEEHTDQVWDLDFSSDGTRLVSVGDDCILNLYQLSM